MGKPCEHSDALWCSMYWQQAMLCPDCPIMYGVAQDIADAQEALADYAKSGGASLEDLTRELDL